MAKIKAFANYSKEYDEWFDNNSELYNAELCLIKSMTESDYKRSLEIGVGTGKFAVPLNIKIGVEPCPQMAHKAKKQGVSVISSIAEHLPFKDNTFDFILMVTTVCFVDDVLKSFEEAYRTLKPGGSFIVAYVDKNSELGRRYELKKGKSRFYQEATFYGTEDILKSLKFAKFNSFDIKQTIFNSKQVDLILNGYGKGSFVAILAKK